MKREDFERSKLQEKEHLREIQKLKKRLREAERTRSIGRALQDVKSAGSTEDFDRALSNVKLEAAQGEAKFDMALTAGEEADRSVERDVAQLDDDLAKEKAAQLVKHMKVSMGMADEVEMLKAEMPAKSIGREQEAENDEEAGEVESKSDSESEVAPKVGEVPKTIGRMKPSR